MPILVQGLTHTYLEGTPFAAPVLHGVDLEIGDGELVGLIGPTRSGKSTLAQYLNGLFIPREGRVVVDGVDTADPAADLLALRQRVGLVFQYPEHQLFAETVGEDVAFGPRNLGLPPAEVERRVGAALATVGLDPEEFRDRYIFALSGGQKRRAAIAGVLALEPRILVLDDPTAGLDPRGRDDLLATIRDLHRSRRISVVLISSSLAEVARVAERVVVLAAGRVVAAGPTRSVFAQVDLMREVGLGLLPTVELMASLRQRGYDVPLGVLTAAEAAAVVASLPLPGLCWREGAPALAPAAAPAAVAAVAGGEASAAVPPGAVAAATQTSCSPAATATPAATAATDLAGPLAATSATAPAAPLAASAAAVPAAPASAAPAGALVATSATVPAALRSGRPRPRSSSNLELARTVTLGQYIPGDSPVHRLDPRVKILLWAVLAVALFAAKTFAGQGLLALLILALIPLSHLPPGYVLQGLRPMLPLLAFIYVFQVLFSGSLYPDSQQILGRWWVFEVTMEGVWSSTLVTLRVILLYLSVSLLTLTTSLVALTDAMERLMAPLSRLGVPSNEIAMVAAIAVRFVPTLVEEMERIIKAQMARGARLETGGVIRRTRARLPLFVPLFLNTLRRAEDLIVAMEARCYRGGRGRTRRRQLRLGGLDAWAAAVAVGYAALAVALPRIYGWP